jgi:tetratricopeptide (TPR) repeat protein
VLCDIDRAGALRVSVSDLIIQKAEGNPLYLEELYSAIVNDPDPGLDRGDAALPGALETLLLARIDALPGESRRLLQAAAVLGRRFLKEVLIGMAPSGAFDEELTALLRADVIREHGFAPAGFAFRHGLVREAALSTLTPLRYRQLSAAAASALKNWEGFDIESDADALAGHFLAAGDLAHAIEPLERLGDRLALVYRFEEAIGLFRRCLVALGPAASCLDAARLARKQSEAEAAIGHVQKSLQLLDLALESESDDAERGALLVAKAEQLADFGKSSEASEVLWEVVKLEGDLAVRGKALTRLGMLALARQDVGEAQWCVDLCVNQLRTDQSSAFEIASLAAGIHATRGELELAEIAALKAQAISDRSGRVKDQLEARRHVAIVCMLKGAMREAFELQRQVYESCDQFHLAVPKLDAGVNVITFANLVGELEYGKRVGDELLSTDLGASWIGIGSNLAGILIEFDDVDAAERLALNVLDNGSRADNWERTIARRMFGICRQLCGDYDGAREAFTVARNDALQLQLPSEVAFDDVHLAQLSYLEGRFDRVREESIKGLTDLGHLDAISRAIVEGRHLALLGLLSESVGEQLEEILRRVQQMGLRLWEARTLIALGSVNPDRSEQYFNHARQIFEECGCKRGLAELEEARHRLIHGVGVQV